jgi:CDP-6-deoxy-D-xylo-4-hexulose-3-dehydrase
MGEGGAVFTSTQPAPLAWSPFRDWGRDCYCAPGMDNTCKRRFDWQLGDLPYGYDHKYVYSHLGYNLKITDMQAAGGPGADGPPGRVRGHAPDAISPI